MWNTNFNPNPPPPAQGFFRIFQWQAETSGAGARSVRLEEGSDVNGLPSYYQTTASLAYTISLNGTRRNDFLSASVAAGSPLLSDPTLGPPDQRYQDTANVYNSPSAEAALFLVPTNDVTDAADGAKPLFSLYRRQLLTAPPTQPVGQFSPTGRPPRPSPAPVRTMWKSAPSRRRGRPRPRRQLVVQQPDRPHHASEALLDGPGNLAGVYQARAGAVATPRWASATRGYQAADLLMPDVVSMDVRVLVQGGSDFEDLFDLTNPNRKAPGTNNQWYFPFNNGGFGNARVFDTWAATQDPNIPAYNYTTWQTPDAATSIPIYKDNNGNTISIQAIQITLRVWDFKTKKTRQVTIVQQMSAPAGRSAPRRPANVNDDEDRPGARRRGRPWRLRRRWSNSAATDPAHHPTSP